MGETEGLWTKGTYWHLETRPDELRALKDIRLKMLKIDTNLIIVDLNFCSWRCKTCKLFFSEDKSSVAAVDFQVGGGCGMKDVAYFIDSCLYDEECEALERKFWIFTLKNLKSIKDKGKRY